MRFSVRMTELPAFIEPGGTGVVFIRARPEEAVCFINALPGHSRVIRDAALRCHTEFSEDVLGRGVVELVTFSQSRSKIAKNLPVLARFPRRGYSFAMQDDSALHVGRGSLVLFHQRTRKHDVGIAAGL